MCVVYIRACPHCGRKFTSRIRKRSCSPECGRALMRRSAQRRADAQKVTRACVVCGRDFWRRRHSKSSSKSGGKPDQMLCCSQRCGWRLQSRSKQRKRSAKLAGMLLAALRFFPFLLAIEYQRLVRAVLSRPARKPKRLQSCVECGCHYQPNRRWQRACSERCRRVRKDRARANAKRAYCARAGGSHHVSHSARARKTGAAVERVHRLKVFARDRWTCQLCGRHTPRRLLKDFKHPHAPTLDHIVPISRGGGHTWANVQCCAVRGQFRLAL